MRRMNDRSRALVQRAVRSGTRAATGIIVIAAAALLAVSLHWDVLPLPSVVRDTVAVTVDTSQSATVSLTCTGSFAELGADPTQPTAAIPSGESQVIAVGEMLPDFERELTRERAGGTAPRVFEAPFAAASAAAEVQQVATPTLQGLSASSCVEPVHEQWLVGGDTTLGKSVTLVLGNPSEVPATVQLTIYDEQGLLDASHTAGVLVPAGAQRIVSLGAYAPARERLAVRVESTGAAVTAALGISHTVDIRSYAVDTVTRQLAPATELVLPAVANVRLSAETAADGPDIPVLVRLLAPGKQPGSARVHALLPNGDAREVGHLELNAGEVTDLELAEWPAAAQAVVVSSTVPVVGGVRGSADVAPEHDYAWFAPAPLLPAEREVMLAIVPGGQLVLVNPGVDTATVNLHSAQGENRTITLLPGSAVPIAEPGVDRLRSTTPIVAGVRVVNGPQIAGYPVLAPIERGTALTIYPR